MNRTPIGVDPSPPPAARRTGTRSRRPGPPPGLRAERARTLNGVLTEYGPWLTTLENDDDVAIVLSGRMYRIEDWDGGVMGRHFARVMVARGTGARWVEVPGASGLLEVKAGGIEWGLGPADVL